MLGAIGEETRVLVDGAGPPDTILLSLGQWTWIREVVKSMLLMWVTG